MKNALLLLLAAAVTTGAIFGCALGPDHKRPDVKVTDKFRGQEGPADNASLADLPWWEVFKDDALKGLIDEALKNSPDVISAAARVEQYRALLGVARADFYPQIQYNIQGYRGQNAATYGLGANQGNSFGGTLSLNWELDIWGRIRRSSESAMAQLLSTEWARRGVILSLVAQVAQAYLELRELDMELDIAKKSVLAFQDTYDLFARKVTGGATSKQDTASAGTALAQARATVPAIENKINQKENQINLLLGRPPQPIPRGAALTSQAMPPTTPAGLPSTLLERRPDIIGAENDLRSANAKVGQAKANFFPKLSLTGLFGAISPDLQTFQMAWAAGGSLQGPLFQGLQVYDNYAAAKAFWEQSKQSYIKTVMTALQDVSNALTAQQKLEQVRKEQANQVDQARELVRITTLRYMGGLDQYYEVMQALTQLFPAETALAQTERDRLLSVVSLYKALGGGWTVPNGQEQKVKGDKSGVMVPVPYLPVQKNDQQPGATQQTGENKK